MKNIKSSEKAFIALKQAEREAGDKRGNNLQFKREGRRVPAHMIDRWKKSNQNVVLDQVPGIVAPSHTSPWWYLTDVTAETPSGFSYGTDSAMSLDSPSPAPASPALSTTITTALNEVTPFRGKSPRFQQATIAFADSSLPSTFQFPAGLQPNAVLPNDVELRRTLKQLEQQKPVDYPAIINVLGELSYLTLRQVRLVSAEEYARRRLDLCRQLYGDQTGMTMDAIADLSKVFHCQGNLEAAERLQRKVHRFARTYTGEQSLRSAAGALDLACTLLDRNKLQEACGLARSALDIFRKLVGDDHWLTAQSLALLFILRDPQAPQDDIENSCLALTQRQVPDTNSIRHPLALIWGTFFRVYTARGYEVEALDCINRAVNLHILIGGPEDPCALATTLDLATHEICMGSHNEAKKKIIHVLETSTRVLGRDHCITLMAECRMAELHLVRDLLDAAHSVLIRIIPIQRRTLGNRHTSTIWSIGVQARVLKKMGWNDEAEQALEEVCNVDTADTLNPSFILESAAY